MARSAQVVADDVDEGGDGGQELSLRETIEASRDEVIDRQAEERGANATDENGEAISVRRDNSGRFTRREPAGEAEGAVRAAPRGRDQGAGAGEGAPNAEARVQQQAPNSAQPDGQPQQQPPPQGLDVAPQAWTPAAKAEWSKLPPSIRAEINRREADVHRAITARDEERAYGRSFAEIAQQHQGAIARAGVPPQRIFADFLNIMGILSGTDQNAKLAIMRDTAIRNGLDLRALAGMPFPGPPGQNPQIPGQQPRPPMPQAVIPPEIAQAAREWNQFKQQQEQERAAREQREAQETLNEIINFRAQPDAPYFDAVKDQMVALLQAGAASTLKEAYDQAIWTRPDIRAALQAQEAQKAQAEAARRERTQRARLKGGSVRGGSGSVAPAESGGRSIREELQAGFAEARARV